MNRYVADVAPVGALHAVAVPGKATPTGAARTFAHGPGRGS